MQRWVLSSLAVILIQLFACGVVLVVVSPRATVATKDRDTRSGGGHRDTFVVAAMRTGKDRVRCVAVQQPVLISGVCITPGDLITADGDGVVAVGAGHLDTVVELAEHIEHTERRIVEVVRAGSTLAQARADLGLPRPVSRTA